MIFLKYSGEMPHSVISGFAFFQGIMQYFLKNIGHDYLKCMFMVLNFFNLIKSK